MTAQTFRPAPNPHTTVPSLTILAPTAAPRPARAAAHRAPVRACWWRLPALIAAAVLVGFTLLLGMVGWVALLTVGL